MKACLWYDVDEKLPPKTGYYLAFKGYSMGDDETGCGYYYWNAKRCEWLDSGSSQGRHANVIHWTDADPESWYEKYSMRRRDEVTAAEKDAWNAVLHAVEQYEMVTALTKT